MNEKLEKLVEKLTLDGKTISTMESCTGGALASAITNISGSSEVLNYSAVTYSNEFKVKMGVSKKTIDKYTVYSAEVAQAMAKAISDFTLSNYGVGITGKLNRVDIHNLSGNDDEVFISIYNRDNDSYDNFKMFVTKEGRKDAKEEVVLEILNHLV